MTRFRLIADPESIPALAESIALLRSEEARLQGQIGETSFADLDALLAAEAEVARKLEAKVRALRRAHELSALDHAAAGLAAGSR